MRLPAGGRVTPKFAAAAAPFFVQHLPDLEIALILLAVFMLADAGPAPAVRATPAVRRMTPDWAAGHRRMHVPVGVALAATLVDLPGNEGLSGLLSRRPSRA